MSTREDGMGLVRQLGPHGLVLLALAGGFHQVSEGSAATSAAVSQLSQDVTALKIQAGLLAPLSVRLDRVEARIARCPTSEEGR